LKITFICPSLNAGGGTKVVCIYAGQLQSMGHQVTIVATPHQKVGLARKLKRLATRGEWPRDQVSIHTEGKNLNCITLEQDRPIVASDVPDGDAVIATWWETAEWVNSLPSSKGQKFYFIQHHEVFDYLPPRSRDTYKLPLRKIVVSKWLRDVMNAEYGEDCSLIPNTVDRSHFYAPERTKQPSPTVGLLYGSASFKGLDISLQALNRLRSRIPDLRVVSFGSETPQPSLRLPPRSKFHFRPSQDKIRELYSSCDVWLTASKVEGFNLPALEAMACRAPVVSTKAGWPADGIIDKINGRLVDVDDVDGLTNALEWVLSRPEHEWRQLSEAAYQTMTLSSWQEGARLFESELMAA
jgi:glycosyltransferase involved in cell wall biosynthesis